MPAWRATITILDNKRKLSNTRVWLDVPSYPDEDFATPYEYLQVWYLPALDAIITGQIVNVSLSIDVPVAGLGLKSLPLAISDCEEGALFVWEGSGYTVLQTIPTFDEQFIIDGTDLVDLNATEVQQFITVSILATELPSGGFNTGTSDNRGVAMTRLKSAREQFKRG